MLFLNLFLGEQLFSQKLVAHYSLDGNALDGSVYKNHGKIIGGVTKTTDRFGNPCGAMFFNGTDGFIQIPSSPSLNSISEEISISGWFKLPNNTMSGDFKWLTMVCKGDILTESIANPHFRLQTFQSSLQSTISINSEFTEYDLNYTKHQFDYDKWYLYVMVYDGNSVITFLNGVEIWRYPYSNALTSNNSPLYIGKDIPGSIEFYAGTLDDVRIYDGALTNSEIKELFNDNSESSFREVFDLKCPSNLNINTNSLECYATVNYKQPQIIIHCDKIPVTVNQIAGLPSGSKFPVGNNSIIFQAVSSTGFKKTCFSSVVVKDIYPPIINCHKDTTLIIVNEQDSSIKFSFELPQVTDNCPNVLVKQSSGLSSNSNFPVGSNHLAFIAIDQSGNTSECSYSVIVKKQHQKLKIELENEINADSQVQVIRNFPDSIKYTKDLEFDKCLLTVVLYDDGEQDFDTISVFFNGKEIVKSQLIQLKKNGTINKVLLLSEDEQNDFVVRAWNNGNISPNTLKIDFYEGYYLDKLSKLKRMKPKESRILHSKPGLASAIYLKCKAN